MNIQASYNPPPIPLREYDWRAIDDDTYNGPGYPIGFGQTETEAVTDLLIQLEMS